MRSLAVALALCLLAGSCRGYELATLPPGRRPALGLTVRAQHAESLTIEVLALLERGTDAEGRLTTPVATAIVVDGERVDKLRSGPITPEDWQFHWTRTWTQPELPATIRIEIPAFDDAAGSGMVIDVPIPRRGGARVVSIPREGDLRLPTAMAVPTALGQRMLQWWVRLGAVCGTDGGPFAATGFSRLPAEIRVSRAMVTEYAPGGGAACLTMAGAYFLHGGPYPVQVEVHAQVDWEVEAGS